LFGERLLRIIFTLQSILRLLKAAAPGIETIDGESLEWRESLGMGFVKLVRDADPYERSNWVTNMHGFVTSLSCLMVRSRHG
jgi:hypothetical protein